jgi:hypothetical protein
MTKKEKKPGTAQAIKIGKELARRKDEKPRTYNAVTLSDLKRTIYKWLNIKDQNVIEIVLAFSIGERLPGDPLWLFLIAPPGGAKTELLRAIEGSRHYHLSDLTSKTFVSGLMLGTGEQRRKIEDLLPQLDKQVLIFKDFTTVLEKNKDERAEIFAQLREIYDGKFSKKFGTMDKKVSYEARFGLVAGVTPVIDRYWKVMQQLGERFLKYRWDEDADLVTRQALAVEGQEAQMREEIHTSMMGFLTHLSVTEPTFPKELEDPLISAAMMLATLRTPITIRSSQSDFYYDFIPMPERPTRLVKQLKKLCKALAVVRGRDAVESSDVLTAIDVALSTAPQDRMAVLKAVREKEGSSLDGCTVVQIRQIVGLPETSIRNILQQLSMLNLVIESKVSREKGGWQEHITYYKLSSKVGALSPPAFLEASKQGEGGSARVIVESMICEHEIIASDCLHCEKKNKKNAGGGS